MGTLKVNNIQSTIDGSVSFPQGLSSSTQPISIPNGTASSPSIRFDSDPDTGIYRIDANTIGISTNGSEKARIDNNGLEVIDGTVSNPSISFINDSDTGLYRIGSNDIGVSAGGSKVLELDPNTFSTFQGGIERFRIASNGQINAVIPGSSTLYNGFLCRAWVNFDGTLSGTITPRASGNISSVTKISLGVYTISFLNPMPDVNYCIAGACNYDTNGWGTVTIHSANNGNVFSTSSIIIRTLGYANIFDPIFVCLAVFR